MSPTFIRLMRLRPFRLPVGRVDVGDCWRVRPFPWPVVPRIGPELSRLRSSAARIKHRRRAINAVFPKAVVQTCIVLLIRNSMDFASWKGRKAITAELKTVYRAVDAVAGDKALDAFDAGKPQGRGGRRGDTPAMSLEGLSELALGNMTRLHGHARRPAGTEFNIL
jgi:hypothetical protein